MTVRRKVSILEFAPAEYVETMVELALGEAAGRDLIETAVARGVPIGIARNIASEPRFAIMIARRAADALARDAVPIAVKALKEAASGRPGDVPAAVRVQAARTILQHADRYVDGHLTGAKREQDLNDMDLDELRALVDAGEARLAAAARDVNAPDSAPNAPPLVDVDLLEAMK